MDRGRISRRLIELRTEAGLTQAQAARAMGFRQSTYSMWEHGARVPRDDSKERIVKFFQASVAEIFYV